MMENDKNLVLKRIEFECDMKPPNVDNITTVFVRKFFMGRNIKNSET